MFNCFRRCRLFTRSAPRWQSHLEASCLGRGQKCAWARMLIDNFDLIRQETTIYKALQLQVRSTNIASQIVKTITNHYQAEQNPFRVCIQLFGSYLKVKYGDKINPSPQALSRMQKDYSQFASLLADLIVLYYDLQERQIIGEDVFYKITLPSFIDGLLFQNKDVLGTVVDTVKGVYRERTQKIKYHIEKMKNLDIEDFQLSIQLCLNQQTLKMFEIFGSGDQSSYRGVVQVLLEVVRIANPSQKIKLMQGLQKQVHRSVMQFYKKYGIAQNDIQINRQDLQAIFLYVIVESNQAITYAHFQIAKHFASSRSKNNTISLDCLQAAFNQIERGTIHKQQKTQVSQEQSQSKNYFDQVTSTLDF